MKSVRTLPLRWHRQTWFAFTIFAILLSWSASRGIHVGTDTSSYIENYLNPASAPKAIPDVGYQAFLSVLRVVFPYARAFLVAMAMLVSIPMYRASIKLSPVSSLSILIFGLIYFPYSLNITRQFIAIAIFYGWGVPALKKDRLAVYLLVIAVCVSFHKASIVLMPLALVRLFPVRRIWYLILWFLSFPLVFFATGPLIGSVLERLQIVLQLVFDSTPTYLLNWQMLQTDRSLIRPLIFNGLFLLSYSVQPRRIEGDGKTLLFQIFFFSTLLLNTIYGIAIVDRIILYFQVSFVFLAGFVVRAQTEPWRRFWVAAGIVMVSVAFFTNTFIMNGAAGVF